MNHKSLQTESIQFNDHGFIVFSKTQDDFPIKSSFTVLDDKHENKRKLKIGVSLSSGCPVGCIYCFTNDFLVYRKLLTDEIVEQVTSTLAYGKSLRDDTNFDEIKISFKQMGDPACNPIFTLQALKQLLKMYPSFSFVISTSAPRQAQSFLEKIREFNNRIRLQFSCHTTSDKERSQLIPNMPLMTLGQIADFVHTWEGRVTLNFMVLDRYTISPEYIAHIFDKEKIFIKLNYLDPSTSSRTHNLRYNQKKLSQLEKEFDILRIPHSRRIL